MDQQEYKLTLGLDLMPMPTIDLEQTCLLCEENIQGINYILSVLKPVEKKFYFDENCFNQILAIGEKLFLALRKNIGEVKN